MDKNRIEKHRNWAVHNNVDYVPGGNVIASTALQFGGELKKGKAITIESILGTCFDVSVEEVTEFGHHQAVIPKVTGAASIVGQNQFYFDPDDPLKNGFIFR